MPCYNPACIAAGKQNTHRDEKCGVRDPSRPSEEQRPAHKAYIQKKMEEDMAKRAAKKAEKAKKALQEAVDAAEIAYQQSVANPPAEEAFLTAKNKLGEILYAKFTEALKNGPDIPLILGETMAKNPHLDIASKFTDLCGKITGMWLAEKSPEELFVFAKDVQQWTTTTAEEAATAAISAVISHVEFSAQAAPATAESAVTDVAAQ